MSKQVVVYLVCNICGTRQNDQETDEWEQHEITVDGDQHEIDICTNDQDTWQEVPLKQLLDGTLVAKKRGPKRQGKAGGPMLRSTGSGSRPYKRYPMPVYEEWFKKDGKWVCPFEHPEIATGTYTRGHWKGLADHMRHDHNTPPAHYIASNMKESA